MHVHKLVNIASMVAKLGYMFRKQNLCSGSKNVFDLRQKHFLLLWSKICFHNMFPAWLNWVTFASETIMFLQQGLKKKYSQARVSITYLKYISFLFFTRDHSHLCRLGFRWTEVLLFICHGSFSKWLVRFILSGWTGTWCICTQVCHVGKSF